MEERKETLKDLYVKYKLNDLQLIPKSLREFWEEHYDKLSNIERMRINEQLRQK